MIHAEPHDVRMLVVDHGSLVVRGRPVVADANDGTYSPDGTLVAFVRSGDLWLANADGSGQRRLARTPAVDEWAPSWLPNGSGVVYSARVNGRRQIRVFRLPTGPSQRIDASGAEEYGAAVSPQGRIAFVSTRSGAPAIYVGGKAFDSVPPAFSEITDLTWARDGTRLAYSATDPATNLATIVVDDGSTQMIGPPGIRPVWSPDGSRIVFNISGRLQSIAPDGSDLRFVGRGTPADWQDVPARAPIFPNLVQRPPSGLTIMRSAHGRWLLGFTSKVDNRGPGVLWIKAHRSTGKHVMDVRQLLYLRGGGIRIDPPSGALHYVVAPPHYHWHMLGYVHAELRTAGDFALRVRDHKSGFCIADHYGTAIGVPHGAPRFLSNCEQYDPRATFVEEGASVGYTDRYPAFFHGQQLDITGVKAGRYWLVHRANPDFHLRESRYDDNVAAVLIRLTWRGGVPTVSTLRSCMRERC